MKRVKIKLCNTHPARMENDKCNMKQEEFEKKGIEVRQFDGTSCELRSAEPDSRHVEGYALVFDKESVDFGGWKEKISRGALDGVLEQSDVFALLNHDNSRGILARANRMKGTLKLEVDENGLKYSFDAPKTPLGDEILEYLRRGDITQSSFAFTIESKEWLKKEDGSYLRTITKIRELFDVSPVYQPAYPQTSVAMRELEGVKEQEQEELRKIQEEEAKKQAEAEAEAAERAKAELAEYYANLKKEYSI